MTIDEQISIVKDNLDEYGVCNITRQEYDAIYNKGAHDLGDKTIEKLQEQSVLADFSRCDGTDLTYGNTVQCEIEIISDIMKEMRCWE